MKKKADKPRATSGEVEQRVAADSSSNPVAAAIIPLSLPFNTRQVVVQQPCLAAFARSPFF